jgi:hypothetical protein
MINRNDATCCDRSDGETAAASLTGKRNHYLMTIMTEYWRHLDLFITE